jgi:ABC-type amino acid transport substrate-binding protein
MSSMRPLPLLAVFLLAGAVSAAEPTSGSIPDRPLLVGTKVVKPFAYRDADGSWTGISVDLWEAIADARGWRFEWHEAENTNALVDMVAEGRVDVGIAAITMKPERAAVVDFSNSMYESGLGIAVRAGPAGAWSSLRILASGAFLRVLGGLLLVLAVVGTLIWLAERRANAEQFEPDLRRGLFSGLWWSAVTMTTVGYGDKAPRSVAGRIIGLVWMYLGVVMISSFTAVVASTLTTRQIASTVRGAEDLVRVRVGAKSGESPFDFLQQTGIRPIAFASIREGLDALAQDQIDAFVHDVPVIRGELAEDANLGAILDVLPEPLREEEYGIAVTPTPPPYRNVLREEINAALLSLKTSGKLKEIETRYLGRP